jgi:hypothetical protein
VPLKDKDLLEVTEVGSGAKVDSVAEVDSAVKGDSEVIEIIQETQGIQQSS